MDHHIFQRNIVQLCTRSLLAAVKQNATQYNSKGSPGRDLRYTHSAVFKHFATQDAMECNTTQCNVMRSNEI